MILLQTLTHYKLHQLKMCIDLNKSEILYVGKHHNEYNKFDYN